MKPEPVSKSLRENVRAELGLGRSIRRRSRLLRWVPLGALLCSLTSLPALAQPPYQMEVLGGLTSLNTDSRNKPCLADFDGDGDLEMVVADDSGGVRFFDNVGSPGTAVFVERTGAANPFAGLTVGLRGKAELADLDGDGDVDALVGQDNGQLRFFENTGTTAAPAFVARTGTANPATGIDVGTSSDPALADLDGDADLDLVLGSSSGTLVYFENTGSSNTPAFVVRTGSANPLDGFDVGNASSPEAKDLDGDGDFDFVVGEMSGTMDYFENTGTSTAPAFVERTGGANPFDFIDLDFVFWSTPALADLDADADLDLVMGDSNGGLTLFRNTGSASAPAFVADVGTGNPINGLDIGQLASPDLADLDADGDLDAVVGATSGLLTYHENTGTSNTPAFLEHTGVANPFDGIDVGHESSPDLVDLDADGDLDAVLGTSFGTAVYFANVGSASAPVFVELTGAGNPFDGFDIGGFATPELGDVDGDGDLDMIAGNGTLPALFGAGGLTAPDAWGGERPLTAVPDGIDTGIIAYFENTGTVTAPAFVERLGSDSPFSAIDIGDWSTPEFVDLDQDGDLDLVVGEFLGTLPYFENTGTSLAPAYVERTGTANPFFDLDVGRYSGPELVDLDGDGDFDLFTGENGGRVVYHRSRAPLTLSVVKAGTGDGTVASDPAGISCGVDCSEPFADGSTVTLAATPGGTSEFVGWSGGGCSGTGPCVVTMTSPRNVTAIFDLLEYELTVSKSGAGAGSVASSPAGIDCGSDCTEIYSVGTEVTLTATADPGSVFVCFAGGGCSGAGPCVVTMSEARAITARFEPPEIFADDFEGGDTTAWSLTVP